MKILGSTAYAPRPLAAWLRISGPDAPSFLQGQFSRDLRGMPEGGSRYGLWLDHKGKVLADSMIIKGPSDVFWCASDETPAEVLRERFDRYIIADDVTLEDATPGWDRVVLVGDDDLPAGQAGVGHVTDSRRARVRTRDWFFPREDAARVREALRDWAPLDARDLERIRIEAGIPSIPADLGPDDLPQEGGLGESAVSYEKGCYLGQEVMARLKAMGRIRRRLCLVGGRGPRPEGRHPLFAGETRVGELRTTAAAEEGFVGLAMVANAQSAPGVSLALGSATGEGVTVLPLP